MTRITKGQQSGELWDKVKLANGMVGYAFQNYLEEIKEPEIPEEPIIEVSEINLSLDKNTINKGESLKLNVQILPEDATNKKIIFSSSNNNVAEVDSIGNILGISSRKSNNYSNIRKWKSF